MKTLFLLILLGGVVLANNTSDAVKYKTSVAVLTGCAVADIVTTRAVLNSGGVELNPFTKRSPYIGKAIVTGSVLVVGWLIQRRRPTMRKSVATWQHIIGGSYCGAAVWNSTQVK